MIYKDINELRTKCDNYMKSTKLVAPRAFRIYIGVSKQLLSIWKNNNKDYFDLIKEYEDKILSKVEEYAIYGEAHPDIKREMIIVNKKVKYNKQGGVSSEEYEQKLAGKFNQVSAFLILKAYDRDQYIPETAQLEVENKDPIIIGSDNNSGHKLEIIEITPKEK